MPGNPHGMALEPAAQTFADNSADPPHLYQVGVEAGRATVHRVQSTEAERPEAKVDEVDVPVGGGRTVPVRIVRPARSLTPRPVVLYVNGVGWVFGSAHTHDRLVRELADGADVAVVFPEYTHAPEGRYPTAVEECYAVAQWVTEHGADHGIDGSRMAVAGDSAGGNVATAVALLAGRRGHPAFRAQVLFYPVTDVSEDTDSMRYFASGYSLSLDGFRWFWDQYAPDQASRTEPTASPLRADIAELAGLPPTLIITAEADIVRDQGEAYAAALLRAGVDVAAVRYQGVIHDFVMLDAMRPTWAAGAAITQACSTLRDALHAGVTT